MQPTDMSLAHTAMAAALGTLAAAFLALASAAVLVALEELALRRCTNYLSIWAWLARQSNDLRMEAPWYLRGFLLQSSGRPRSSDALDERLSALDELANDRSTPEQGRHARMLKVLFGVIGAAMALPERQLLGVLSATVQADASRPRPGEFVRWIAAIGSLPVTPSPFAASKAAPAPAPAPEPPGTEASADGPSVQQDAMSDSEATLQAAGSEADVQMLVQGQAERALDSLQVYLAAGWRVGRYSAALLVVWFIHGAFTSNFPPYEGLSRLSFEFVFRRFIDFSPNVAIWLTATALVPMFMAPLQRLTGHGR